MLDLHSGSEYGAARIAAMIAAAITIILTWSCVFRLHGAIRAS